MPLIVTRDLEIVELSPASQLPDKLKLFVDTEYQDSKKMVVECIGIYAPLLNDHAAVWMKSELTNDFHPIITLLELHKFLVEPLSEEDLEPLTTELLEIQESIFECESTAKGIKKAYEIALTQGMFDELLTEYNLDRSAIRYRREKKESHLDLVPPTLEIEIEFFFATADIFKIGGTLYQEQLLNAYLTQYRTFKLRKPLSFYANIDNKLYEIKVNFRDSYHRIPPLTNRSLDGNCKSLGMEIRKLEIDTPEIRSQLGLESSVKEHFSLFADKMPLDAAKYNAKDLFTSADLSEKQQELLNHIRSDFGLENVDIADTTGSTVSRFIIDLVKTDIGALGDKEKLKLLTSLLGQTKVKNLQRIELNNFGIQPFMTVGGLLFSRTPKYPLIEGKLSDCDLSSCYATSMSNMHIYLGEPVTLTFKYPKSAPTLREVLEFIETTNAPRDGFFVRVSGDLKNAFNTLVLSDLRFKKEKVLMPNEFDLNESRKSIELFDAFKTPKKNATSTLLLKQIKFGLINQDTIDCLKLLPESWYQEYLDLKVDCLAFHPAELICDTLEEVAKLRSELPDEPYTDNFDKKSGLKTIKSQYYNSNATLRVDIGKYWNQLRNQRAIYKKAKKPVQEIYKLFGNSGYGVMACLYLASNNLMASNQITSGARSGAWLMLNTLNGFGPITDGTCFNWLTVPLGQTFRGVLAKNPHYLFDYDSTIANNNTDYSQQWFDDNFKKHLLDFYEIDSNHIPANRFNFELKTETFYSSTKPVETTLFTRFFNTNAGNYSKGLGDETILIEGTDYDFEAQQNYLKARSFRGNTNNLIEWYCRTLKEGYTEPLIYDEFKLIKFGEANRLAIKFLDREEIEEIAHPLGFSTRTYKAMKLISRSQFLFLNESQLKNFETNEHKLAELSKELLDKKFWQKITTEDLAEYGAEILPGVDYFNFSKTHAVGTGFELLTLTKTRKGDIKALRTEIFERILNGCRDFNAELNINRNFKLGNPFKLMLAAIIVHKANTEQELLEKLKNSTNCPVLLTVNRENIQILADLKKYRKDN
ncbi:hypothetical protein [Laspinema olomoucense]|uniref:Uncharacterized protein n=1 Tax=Laspinema olomoucense D3b TaxID=2953688 RepID=A0ABT2NFV4_9CYAN|nr:hypothetical protein [Laspinema sp. D3b]MCT7981595.1 hypothetical protein [Laspinema sp. D3b]